MERKQNNEVVNQVIVRLNEFKSVKMSSISKTKRPAAKFNKEVASYLLENWDDVKALKLCRDNMRKDMPHASCEEVMGMYENRIKELEPKVKIDYAKLDAFKGNPDTELNDAERQAWSILNGYFSSEDEPALRKDESLKELWKYVDSKSKKAAKEKTKPEPKKKAGRKSVSHEVGEHHPTQPWVWTEYKPGMFDWRADPKVKKTPGRKAGQVTIQQTEKKAARKAGNVAKQAKNDGGVTLDELLKKPTPSNLSTAQKKVMKAIRKGFRLYKDSDGKLWLRNGDANESVEEGVLQAIQRKYKIDSIPDGIWYQG